MRTLLLSLMILLGLGLSSNSFSSAGIFKSEQEKFAYRLGALCDAFDQCLEEGIYRERFNRIISAIPNHETGIKPLSFAWVINNPVIAQRVFDQLTVLELDYKQANS